MVLGLLTIAAIPTTIGVAEGISSRNKEQGTCSRNSLVLHESGLVETPVNPYPGMDNADSKLRNRLRER